VRELRRLIFAAEDLTQSTVEVRANTATRELTRRASRSAIPIVVLGTVQHGFGALTAGDLVAKPYHYAPLLRKIEELLGL